MFLNNDMVLGDRSFFLVKEESTVKGFVLVVPSALKGSPKCMGD